MKVSCKDIKKKKKDYKPRMSANSLGSVPPFVSGTQLCFPHKSPCLPQLNRHSRCNGALLICQILDPTPLLHAYTCLLYSGFSQLKVFRAPFCSLLPTFICSQIPKWNFQDEGYMLTIYFQHHTMRA